MKADLDHLMRARDLAAVVVECTDHFSAPRSYLTGGVSITQGKVIKKQGAAPILIVNPMEVEEAKKSGLTVLTYLDLGWAELLKAAEGDRDKAAIAFWQACLTAADVDTGKIGIYGVGDFNAMLALVTELRQAAPQYEFAGEGGMTLFHEAFMTKDADEVARMRDIGQRVGRVLEATWDYIAGHRAQGDAVVNREGAALTVGMVKRFVRRTLLDQDLEDTDMIFAPGRDGGFPHSRGEAHEPLKLGQAIVFDLFPRELGGGYFHDCTRTWSIGYASDRVRDVYETVIDAFELAVENIRPGIEAGSAQAAVQDFFEARGHKTSRSDPMATEGYVHGLGHGVGMNIHERPNMSHLSHDTLQAGNVITIEPGLYYPSLGFGTRVEDTFYISESGALQSLTPFHKELVLPLQG
jgi:Xaa-Pro aminopeptidase